MKKSQAGQMLQIPALCLHTFTLVNSAHAGYCGMPKGPGVDPQSSNANWLGGIWPTGS